MGNSSKSKNFLNRVAYGLLSDMFCENDFSLHNDTFNRRFKDGTIRKTMKVSHEFRKEYKKHEFIDN